MCATEKAEAWKICGVKKQERKKEKKKKKKKEKRKRKGMLSTSHSQRTFKRHRRSTLRKIQETEAAGIDITCKNGVRSGDHRDSWLRSDTAKAIMGSWPAYFRDTADEDESSSDSNEEEDQVVGRIDVPSRATTRSSNFSVITSKRFPLRVSPLSASRRGISARHFRQETRHDEVRGTRSAVVRRPLAISPLAKTPKPSAFQRIPFFARRGSHSTLSRSGAFPCQTEGECNS